MKSRQIQTRFYKDSFIRGLSSLEKFLFSYLLTNEHVNIIHCYECPDDVIRFETGVDQRTLDKAKLRFSRKIRFFKGYVHLVNAKKYESYQGETNRKAKGLLLRELSPDVLAWFNNPLDTPMDTPMDTPQRGTSISININKGGVLEEGGRICKNSLVPCTESCRWEIGNKLGVHSNDVGDIAAALQDNIELGNPKKYKVFHLALLNWVRFRLEKHPEIKMGDRERADMKYTPDEKSALIEKIKNRAPDFPEGYVPLSVRAYGRGAQ